MLSLLWGVGPIIVWHPVVIVLWFRFKRVLSSQIRGDRTLLDLNHIAPYAKITFHSSIQSTLCTLMAFSNLGRKMLKKMFKTTGEEKHNTIFLSQITIQRRIKDVRESRANFGGRSWINFGVSPWSNFGGRPSTNFRRRPWTNFVRRPEGQFWWEAPWLSSSIQNFNKRFLSRGRKGLKEQM